MWVFISGNFTSTTFSSGVIKFTSLTGKILSTGSTNGLIITILAKADIDIIPKQIKPFP